MKTNKTVVCQVLISLYIPTLIQTVIKSNLSHWLTSDCATGTDIWKYVTAGFGLQPMTPILIHWSQAIKFSSPYGAKWPGIQKNCLSEVYFWLPTT